MGALTRYRGHTIELRENNGPLGRPYEIQRSGGHVCWSSSPEHARSVIDDLTEGPDDGPTYSEGHWAPVVLETLVHAHAWATPMRDAPATRSALKCLQRGGLIEPADTLSGWWTTAKGKEHLERLCALPYPV